MIGGDADELFSFICEKANKLPAILIVQSVNSWAQSPQYLSIWHAVIEKSDGLALGAPNNIQAW